MKGQISRYSHRPEERYSGFHQVQGGMVTDANLSESTEITKDRTDGLGLDTVLSGCPADGGIVDLEASPPLLREGTVYADGVRGLFRLSDGAAALTLADVLTGQADLPDGPALTNGERVIFADIWERPVFTLEDPYLADAGLHGAETGFRSRTMCQIKSAPIAALAELEARTGRYVSVGDVTLEVEPPDETVVTDPCDPCANVLTLEQRVPNALFRIEIVRVDGPANAPTRVDIAWSRENGANIAPKDVNVESFARDNSAYEMFSKTTESHMGAFAASNLVRNSQFISDLTVPPVALSAFDFIRRWDGHASIRLSDNSVTTIPATAAASFDGDAFSLTTTDLTARLQLGGRSVLRGDYWLAELRTHAEEDERIRLISPTPVGIRHHYCILGRSNNGELQPFDDAQRRRLSFPALSALPADHVGFANNCAKLYGTAENVQAALDALCGQGFSGETLVRHTFDWGVVCGLVVRLVRPAGDEVTVSPGHFIDRAGQLLAFKGGTINLTEIFLALSEERRRNIERLLQQGEACLTLATDERQQVAAFIVPRSEAFGPSDPSFLERLRNCVEKSGRIKLADKYLQLAAADQQTIGKLALVAAHKDALSGAQKMSRGEANVAANFADGLLGDFKALADEEEFQALEQKLARIDQELALGNTVGDTREVRQMQLQSARFTAIVQADEERARRCLCETIFTACPPALGEPPYHVPIACLEGSFNGRLFIRKVCMFDCRKQALTWRAVDYLFKEFRQQLTDNMAKLCCGEDDDDDRGIDLNYNDKLSQANLNELINRYGITRNVFTTEGQPATLFQQKLNVRGLTVEAATEMVAGNGANLVDTVDIGATDATAIIERYSSNVRLIDQLGETGTVSPGDKVVLLTQNGQARGYLVVEKGQGRYFFDTSTKKTDRDIKRIEDVLDRFDKIRVEGLKTDIDGLTLKRDDLVTGIRSLEEQTRSLADARAEQIEAFRREKAAFDDEVAQFKRQAETLDGERDKAVSDIREARAVLDELSAAQDGVLRQIAQARNELQQLDAGKTKIVTSIRRQQSLESAGITGRTLKLLQDNGIFSIKDVTTQHLNRMVQAGQITAAIRDDIQSQIKGFLTRDID